MSFQRDTSGLSGGALYLHSSTATVRNANMTACHSQSHGKLRRWGRIDPFTYARVLAGGAIGVYTGATLTLTDSSLERNVAGNPTAAPAGVCMSQLSGTACGGGMAVVGANARANVSRCSWTHNTAENKGTLLFVPVFPTAGEESDVCALPHSVSRRWQLRGPARAVGGEPRTAQCQLSSDARWSFSSR